MGFKPFKKSYNFKDQEVIELPAIALESDIKALAEILGTADQPMVIEEDSVLYDASFYWSRPGSQAGGLIEQLPGISIDRNGNLTLFGEEIKSIRVNGEEYFGGEISMALNNLPAEIIEQIQIFDDYGERAEFTGVRMGESQKVINIETNTDQGYTIRPHAAAGSKKRYLGDFSAHTMKGSREIAAFGSLYNTPSNPYKRPFGFGSSYRVVGGARYGGSSLGRDSQQFTGGVHYKNKFGDKTKMNGNYQYSDKQNTNSGRTEKQTLFEDFTNINNRSYVNSSDESTHKLDYNLELQPDSVNKFYIRPSLQVSSSQNNRETDYHVEQNDGSVPRIVEGSSINETEALDRSVKIPFEYIRRFSKQGRSFNAKVTTSFSNRNQDQLNRATNMVRRGDNPEQITETNQFIEQKNKTFSSSSNISYTEPLADRLIADISYRLYYSNNTNTQDVFDSNDMQRSIDSLNTDFNKHTLRHQASASIQRRTDNYTLNIGLGLQQQTLNGRESVKNIDVDNSFINVLPRIQFRYTLAQGELLRASYNTGSIPPLFDQLQPGTDFSDPQYPVTGNPDLDAEYSHRLSISYQKGFFGSGDFINVGMNFSQTQNKIIPNIITEFENENTIIQETRYLNRDGDLFGSLRVGFGKAIIG